MANGAGAAAGTAPAPSRAAEPTRSRRWLPASALEFVGCESCRMTVAEYRALEDERIELFDFESARVWRVADGPEAPHEHPLVMFRKFVERVEMVRGAPIMLGSGAGLHLLDTDGAEVRAMHPDEMVFLDPARRERIGSRYVWGPPRSTRTWCWRWTTRRTCGATSCWCTRTGDSRSCGWRFRRSIPRAVPGAGGRD